MSIRARILVLVGCFALMAVTVTSLGLMTINDYNRMMKAYDHAYDSAWRGERFNHLISNIVMETRGLYIARNPEELKTFTAGLRANLDDMEALTKAWQGDVTPAEKPHVDALAAQAAGFIRLRRQVADYAAAGDLTGAETLSTSNRADRIAFQNEVESLVQTTRKDLDIAKARAEDFNRKRAGDFLLTALIGIAVIMGLSLWIVSHFITNPLRNLASAIIRTSRGEYDTPLPETRTEDQDEVASVWRALAVLKERAIEAERLAAAQREAEHEKELKLREILLD